MATEQQWAAAEDAHQSAMLHDYLDGLKSESGTSWDFRRMSRSERYQEYLRADTGETFWEFMKRKWR